MVERIFKIMYRELSGLHEAAFLLALFAGFSTLLALVRDRLFAHVFGAGSELDIYYSAFRIPDLIYVSFASLVASAALIPFIAERMSRPEEARNFFDIDAQVLKKIRETVPQTSLQKKKDRLKNPAGSLEVARPEKVAGKTVFVIDDVTTTGATLLEAKRALLQTGAKKVICFALAH